MTDLSKTTIEIKSTTNKNSINSYASLHNLVNEIGSGGSNINNIIINKNPISNRINTIIYKNDKIRKIIKNLETNSNYKINSNLIRKKNLLKFSTKNISQHDTKQIENKKLKEIKVKSINNYTQSYFSNKNIINNNAESNQSRNKDNNTISKPLYHKINIVNNKIIIINNNRSKGNILKNS